MDGTGLLEVLLVSLPKGPCCLPYVLLTTNYVVGLEAVDYPTFLVLGVLVLRFHEDLFNCGISFEVSLYPILTTCVFETSASPCVYGMTTYPMVHFSLELVVVTMLCCCCPQFVFVGPCC